MSHGNHRGRFVYHGTCVRSGIPTSNSWNLPDVRHDSQEQAFHLPELHDNLKVSYEDNHTEQKGIPH